MEPMIFAIVGDSLSLPLRRKLRFDSPLIDARDMVVEYKDTFPAIIQTRFSDELKCPILVVNNSERGATTSGLFRKISETLRDFQPHVFILNIGTSDSRFRRMGLRTEGGKLWQKIPHHKFEENLAKLLPILVVNKATVIILGIVPASSEVNRKYPESDQQFALYNSSLKQFSAAVNGYFVSFSDLSDSIDKYVAPDGFHYGTRLHQHAALRIFEIVSKLEWKK